jgi:hypothetical protein
VTSLDARALVSEIQQRLENLPEQPWSIEEIRPGHEDEARVYDAGHWGVCKPTPNKPQYRRPIAEFVVAAPRLLTAVLGLIEQQQEEIRKSTEIIRASDVVPCAEHGDLPHPATR